MRSWGRKLALLFLAGMAVIGLAALLLTIGTGSSEAQQGSMHNCPQPGKWAISVWDGQDGTDAGQALATCGLGAVDAAYSLDPQSQQWLGWFPGRPDLSNLQTLDGMQSVIALSAAAATGQVGAGGSQGIQQMQNCPLKAKWATSVWSGLDGTAAGDALATCGANGVDAAYYLDPQTQEWLPWFRERSDLSRLTSLNDFQAVIALGGEGKTIVVTSTADSGVGTLRQALLDAQNSDTITFDTAVFPPSAPATTYLTSPLPGIGQGNLTIDASNAGVILDGGNIAQETRAIGLQIGSNGNVIRGLQIVNFSGNGIELRGQNNTIGGSRELGSGSLGQGNLLSGNQGRGVALLDAGTSFNTIVGNYIGTNVKGTAAWANWNGIHISGASYNDVIDNLVSGNSGYGIELCCTSDTTSNEISSNYVGTDASGAAALGNGSSGISVHSDASHNMIGPDNVIAHNTEDSIAVFSPDSMGNTIAQNSIHDNGGLGIHLFDGGNVELAAPIIFDFDLGAGTVMGATCANCTVEVFSDSADEGGVYEGRITADGLGAFTFGNGASFAGPHLTVTAIDANGNTSELSAPTSGTRRSLILQEGNNLPKAQLQPKPSSELADNRIGVIMSNMLPISDAQGIVAGLTSLRVKRIKWTLNEAEVESNLGGTLVGIDWSEPELYVPPDPGGPDDFATGLANNGIISTYLLNFWDKANHPGGWEPVGSRFKTEEEIQRYLDYVRFIVHHFKDRIQYYEIWNEPDMACPLQCIEVADYINLVRRTVPVIRQEYPAAKVVVGSIVLQNSDSRDWLFSLLASDVMPLVDVVSWHPMFGVSPEHNSQYYYEYPSLVQEIKDVASAHGFKGEYRGDELLWRSPDCFWCYPGDPLDSNVVAAKNYGRGIVMHLGMGVTAGTGGLSDLRRESFSTVQNLCTIMAGATPTSLAVEIQSEATNVKSYGFSLANGDRLFALWTDGVAVDEDPGVEATLTLPGFSGQDVTGIDVLYGFEQQLVTRTEGGNLIIRDLLVKDYPIVLRLTHAMPS